MIERSKALLIDNLNRVIGLLNLSQGGINGTVIDARILFATAVLALPAGIILAHNHPSGDVSPSSADVKMTEMLKRAGTDINIQIIDHLIISPNKFYSFTSDQIITP
jgi:DNA repair protein RadC